MVWMALRCREGRWLTPRKAFSAKKFSIRHRVVEVGRAVAAVIAWAGVINAQDGPVRRFFTSLRHGPSQSVMVVETAAPWPQMVWAYCSRGTVSHASRRVGDDVTGVRTATPYWAWSSWIRCPQSHSLSATMRQSRPRMARVRSANRWGTWETVVPEDAARAIRGFCDAWSWVSKVRIALP